MPGRIAFQGELGAYSHQACRQSRPDMEAVPCATFEEAIDRCRSGDVDLAMLGLENSTYGRVADVHRLLPDSGLHKTGAAEAFEPARRLYAAFGFTSCEPLADYVLDPYSVFMTRKI